MVLAPPPRDQDGCVVPHDHHEIFDGDRVVRRVSEQFIVNNSDGTRRLSTMAFQPSSGDNAGLSVDLVDQIMRDGSDAIVHVTSPRWIGSVCLEVSFLRASEFMVGYDPLEDNEYHGEIWGSFSKARKKLLARNSQWFVAIVGVEIC